MRSTTRVVTSWLVAFRAPLAAGRFLPPLGPRCSLAVCCVAAGLLLLVPVARSDPGIPTDPPKEIATISLPGAQPLSLAAYETANDLFVTDDNTGDLLTIDGGANAVTGRVHVGSAAFALAVNETYGKVYVASDRECCTTGLTEGNGLISVVDARTGVLITQIDPAEDSLAGNGQANRYQLASDEAHGKIYVTFFCPFCDDLGVIDVATNSYTVIAGGADLRADSGIGVNAVTNEIFVPEYGANRIVIVDGATLATRSFDLGQTGGFGPFHIAVNDVENKLYLTMARVPGQGEIGILILDRDTGSYKFVGKDDLEPLAFNPRTNRLFAGVQVGEKGAVVDGATDALTYVKLGGGGIDAATVRGSTDNAYLASQNGTFVLNGGTRCVQPLSPGIPERGGLVATSLAVNQQTGRTYVSNDDRAHEVTVIQDGLVPCRGAVKCLVPKLAGKRLAAAKRALARANCRLGKVVRRRSRRVNRGRVLSQRPAAGKHRPAGTRVAVVIGT
jgi:DNA-binding beta-propeller fold protein YncE